MALRLKLSRNEGSASTLCPSHRPKKKSPKQLSFETERATDRVEEKKDINRIRKSVEKWRQGGYVAITKTTSKLIENSMMNV